MDAANFVHPDPVGTKLEPIIRRFKAFEQFSELLLPSPLAVTKV